MTLLSPSHLILLAVAAGEKSTLKANFGTELLDLLAQHCNNPSCTRFQGARSVKHSGDNPGAGVASSTWPNLAQTLPIKHQFQVLCIFLWQSSCLFLLLAATPSPSSERKINAEFNLIISLCIGVLFFPPSCCSHHGIPWNPVSTRM